ncbi:6872_t:CDS:2, partial [Racocetra fulgida]
LSCPNSVATQQEKNSKITVGYVYGYNYDYTLDVSKLPWNITHMNWIAMSVFLTSTVSYPRMIAFKTDDTSNKEMPFSGYHTYLNKT